MIPFKPSMSQKCSGNFLRFLRVVMAMGCLLSILWCSGIFLGLLQGVAWGRMIYNFQQFLPFEQAVELALSGDEMCGMCEFVAGENDVLEEWMTLWHPEVLLLFFFAPIMVFKPPFRRTARYGMSSMRWKSACVVPDPPVPRVVT